MTNLIDQLIDAYINEINENYLNKMNKYELADIIESWLPEDWKIRKYNSDLYIVKKMKFRGVPRCSIGDIEKILKVYMTDNETLEKIQEELDKTVWSFEHIEDYWENDYAPFIEEMKLVPACVGRSGGWWGIALDKSLSPHDVLTVEINEEKFATEKLRKEIATLIVKNSQWSVDKLIDYIIYEADILPNPEEFIIASPDFIKKIKEIDRKLEEDAKMYEKPESWKYEILEIAKKYTNNA